MYTHFQTFNERQDLGAECSGDSESLVYLAEIVTDDMKNVILLRLIYLTLKQPRHLGMKINK